MFERVTVSDSEVGVLFRKGVVVRVLPPGRYTIWTIRGESVRTVSDVLPAEIDDGPFWTRDMIPVGISIRARFRITDPVKALLSWYDSRLDEELEATVTRLIAGIGWREFAKAHGRLEAEALDRLSLDAPSYGLLIEDVAIVEFRLPRRLRRELKRQLSVL